MHGNHQFFSMPRPHFHQGTRIYHSDMEDTRTLYGICRKPSTARHHHQCRPLLPHRGGPVPLALRCLLFSGLPYRGRPTTLTVIKKEREHLHRPYKLEENIASSCWRKCLTPPPIDLCSVFMCDLQLSTAFLFPIHCELGFLFTCSGIHSGGGFSYP